MLVGLAGCGKQPSTRTASAEFSNPSSAVAQRPGLEQRRAEFLNRVRAADPGQATIQRALINENNELGLIVTRQTGVDDIPKLVKAMLAQMDQAFPDESHTVIIYAPTSPPQPIGTGRMDRRTREMTYTPTSPR